ncbi:MAG: methyltransferase domain-containing protein [Acidimicrobiales bacterium]
MWDPEHYLRFADHRTRPGVELLARIPEVAGLTRRVVDLGAGTGHLTALLAQRWPEAEVTGVDGDAAMAAKARADHPELAWVTADLAAWEPEGPVDVLYSNAALHWLDHHDTLFRRLRSWLAPGGVLAVQMPDNWAAPTHRVPAEVLDASAPGGGQWPEAARAALMRDRLAAPEAYAGWLSPASSLDLWRTTYYQRLTGDDPVWQWTTGSLLIPVLDALGPDRDRFAAEVQARYRQAYPPDPSGVVTLPFSRLFLVAQAPS